MSTENVRDADNRESERQFGDPETVSKQESDSQLNPDVALYNYIVAYQRKTPSLR